MTRLLPTTTRRRLVSAGAAIGLLAVLSTAAFFIGRHLSGGQSAAADPGDPAAQEATTSPPGTPTLLPAVPDTSKPNWAIPYMQVEDAKPRYDQAINGIAIGPNVTGEGCPGRVLSDRVSLEESFGSAVEIAPSYLPAGAEPTGVSFVYACSGIPVSAQIDYYIAPDEEDMQRVSSGEMTYFQARHGGWFFIRREQTATPIYRGGPLASERFRPAKVLGHPAAIGDPIFAEGFGPAAALVWQQSATWTAYFRSWATYTGPVANMSGDMVAVGSGGTFAITLQEQPAILLADCRTGNVESLALPASTVGSDPRLRGGHFLQNLPPETGTRAEIVAIAVGPSGQVAFSDSAMRVFTIQ